MIVAMKHEKRRFVEHVDFVTSPGFLDGGTTRRDSGLAAGGMYRVVTDLGLFGFDDETKRMKIVALHPGVSVEKVQDNTGFKLEQDSNIVVTDRPTEQELAFLRKLDPQRLYTA
jgi:glutaconate CoA-transferase subunit B